MKRGKPLRRRARLRPRSRSKRKAPRDFAYMLWVKQQPCMLTGDPLAGECRGPVHAHHAGTRPGVAMKAPDATCIPLCERHHDDWHACRGLFDATKEARRAWADWAIEATQDRHHALTGRAA